MHLVEWLQRIMVGFGAAWVMWLLIGLSVISVAIILERIWYFSTTSTNLEALKKELHTALEKSVAEAIKHMDASPSAEAAVQYIRRTYPHNVVDVLPTLRELPRWPEFFKTVDPQGRPLPPQYAEPPEH